MIRIGYGYDVHQFAKDRDLIIGGIHIPYDKGLLGHSDADVLLHAITDAILGAAALGDIGKLFPDTDPKFEDADSKELLKEAYAQVMAKGLTINNIDATIIAEAPKFRPYIDLIREVIAEILNISTEQVNVKATTSEKMGFVGRKEGIASHAVILLS